MLVGDENVQPLHADPVRQEIDALIHLARQQRDHNAPQGLEAAARALEQVQALERAGEPYSKGMADALHVLSQLHLEVGNHDAALELAARALVLYSEIEDKRAQAETLLTLAETWRALGNFSTALDDALLALRLSEQLDDTAHQTRALELAAVFYHQLGDHAQELQMYDRALPLYERAGNTPEAAAVLNKMAVAHLSLGASEGALTRALHSLELARTAGARMLEGNVLCTLGDVYVQLGEYGSALAYFEQSIELARMLGFKSVEVYARRRAGTTHALRGEYETSLTLLEGALGLAQELGAPREALECHRALAETRKARGEWGAALNHFEQFHALKESLYSDAAEKRLRQLEIVHRTETVQREGALLRRKNAELEREVAARQRADQALRHYAQELEAQNAELDAFAATVAHGLKTPLTPILAYAGLLEENWERTAPETRAEFLRTIAQSAVKMRDIISHLLLLARLRHVKVFELHAVDMGRVFAQAKERVLFTTSERNAVILEPETWRNAMGSAVWVEEVWANLLSNALEYGGKPPVLTIDAQAEPDGFVRYSVRDNGAELDAAQQARLFEPFERLQTNAIAEGQGLGLAIVRRIVEKMGGRVGVSSQPGHGNTLYFLLPAAGE